MVWTDNQLASMKVMGRFYNQWIAAIEAGDMTGIATQRVGGEIVDDRHATVARYRENVAEIVQILAQTGQTLDSE